VVGSLKPANLIHILLNNHCHESVGGQPTPSQQIDYSQLSMSLGYKSYHSAEDTDSLIESLTQSIGTEGPAFIEVIIKPGSRKDLGRPTTSPAVNKRLFMEFCNQV